MSATIPVEGFTAPGFEAVKDAFAVNLAGNDEVGASFAVARHGEMVVDVWGGFADEARTKPWQKDTIVNVFSTTKGVTALAMAMLVDRGLMSYDDLVVKYWPEFGAHGKDKTTVAQLLSHQAGVCGPRDPITYENLYDQDFMADLLANMEPFFEPGSNTGYHGTVFAHLTAELMRRIDGRTLGTFIREEIAGPLGADFHLGLPPEHDHRVATLIQPKVQVNLGGFKPNPCQEAVFNNPPRDDGEDHHNSIAWRRAELGSVNGHTNGRALAQIYAPLASRQAQPQLISEQTLAKAVKEQSSRPDLVLTYPQGWGAGFMLNNVRIFGPNPNVFGHAGLGGSVAFADPDKGLAVGYAMNQMGATLIADNRFQNLMKALYSAAD